MFVYDLRDLGTLQGGSWTEPRSINNRGVVVGSTLDSNGKRRAFVWKNTLTELPSVPGFLESRAEDINDAGEIVGVASDLSLLTASKWKSGTGTEISPGDAYSHAYSINENGQVAGDTDAKPCIWINGARTIMDGLEEYEGAGSGSAIISTGEVFGFSGYEFTAATKWNTAGVAIALDSPLQPFLRRNFVWAANDSGLAVGQIGNFAINQPYFWSPAGSGLLTPTSTDQGSGEDVNSSGQIAGWYDDGTGPRAALWTGPILTDLNNLIDPNSGWRLTHAACLNDQGQIAGIGLRNGKQRAFLMSPNYRKIPKLPPTFWHIIFGVVNDGPGVVVAPNGSVVPVPPWPPLLQMVPGEYRPMLKELLSKQRVNSKDAGKKIEE